ncbi:MAG TPA: alpha/beta hydrolase [Hyphomicrobiaceae bacterium]|nr:alpha/beta hydrolase [Hyphomicrobiaceae bacterium]
MKTSDVEILIVPGWSSSGPDHWQTRWQRSLKTAQRVEQTDWIHPDRDRWVGMLISTIVKSESDLPVVLVAHSLGVATVIHALRELPAGALAGAFLVAPADVDNASRWPITAGYTFDSSAHGFAPMPTTPLPIPVHVVASTNDPYCSISRAKELAGQWGASLSEAGAAGHINVESGHGPWPEGLMQFGWFLKQIGETKRLPRRSAP